MLQNKSSEGCAQGSRVGRPIAAVSIHMCVLNKSAASTHMCGAEEITGGLANQVLL